MGRVNPTNIQVQIRVCRSVTKSPMNKEQIDADSALRLMQADLQRGDKEHFTEHARKIIRSRKKVAGYQRIMEALTSINDNAIDITTRAAKEKNLPAEFADDIIILYNIGQVLRIQSFDKFKKDIIQSLYPKPVIQAINGQDKLPDVIQDAFLHDGVTDEEFANIYEEFANLNPDFPAKMKEVFGITAGMSAATPMPQMPGVLPQMPQIPGTIPQGYPQMQGFPQGSCAPSQQYQAIDTLFVPVDVPEFSRDRWASLSQAISEATG